MPKRSFQSALCFSLALLAILSACSGLSTKQEEVRASHRTTILFLVDGLAAENLRYGLARGSLREIQNYFLPHQAGFPLARAAFPTLTYSNIASILTTEPIGGQPVIANHVVIAGKKVLNFESPFSHDALQDLTDKQSVFEKLDSENRTSAAFSYVFGQNAPVHMKAGLQEGLEYNNHEYRNLDDRLLGNLEQFLTENKTPELWPEFIYVHLVGVDGTAHRYGPSSSETRNYLSWLDGRMGSVLKKLALAEKQKKLAVLLTSDHGFIDVKSYSEIVPIIKKANSRVVITNESRYLGLHLPERPGSLKGLLKKTLREPGVEFTVLRDGNILELAGQKKSLRFFIGPALCGGETYSLALIPANGSLVQPAESRFQCPSAFDDANAPYPFLISNLASYLVAPNHPDALVIAKPGVSFLSGVRGSHGGPTADELFVPLLSRGVEFSSRNFVRTSDLLKSLHRH